MSTTDRTDRNELRRQYDEAKRANSTAARMVSALLRKSGLPKASAYKSFGRDTQGFEMYVSNLITERDGEIVGATAVLFTDPAHKAEWSARAAEILAADPRFEIAVRPGLTIDVIRAH